MAKPVWEDEPKLRQGLDELSLGEYSGVRRGEAEGQGSVEVVDLDTVDTYGFWDQSLDIMPALSRSVDIIVDSSSGAILFCGLKIWNFGHGPVHII